MTDELKRKLAEHILGKEKSPFVHALGIKDESIEAGRVVLRMDVGIGLTNGYRIAHGGALMTLADATMGATCFSLNKKVVTLEASMSYLRSAPEGRRLRAVGTVLHNGARTMACACDILDEENKLCAQGRGTFFVVGNFTEKDTEAGVYHGRHVERDHKE